jgi:hypothetical protein
VSEDFVKLTLMPRETAVVTARGIKFHRMYYISSQLLKEQAFVKARVQGTWEVKVSFDPRNLSNIYVYDDNPAEYMVCTLAEGQEKYIGKSIEEIDYLHLLEQEQILQHDDVEAQAKAELYTDIESIVKDAEEAFKREDNPDLSNRQRTMNIRSNRQNERDINREKESFVLQSSDAFELDENEFPTEESSLDILLKKQKEGLKRVDGRIDANS